MKPERHAQILAIIAAATSAREMSGIRYSLQQQDEWRDDIPGAFQEHAMARGWWPVPQYPAPRSA